MSNCSGMRRATLRYDVLLDTNVLSEVKRAAPDPKVLAWLDTVDGRRWFSPRFALPIAFRE